MTWEKYKIEKDIPMPKPGRWEEHGRKYPFREMEVGDSFYIPTKDFPDGKKRNGSYFSGIVQKLKPKRFSTRRDDNGIRIWRVE